jgi:asparagine N-glycosylation enzyme membrane subunit Stt3
MDLSGLNGFHLTLVVLTSAFGWLLLIANRIWPRPTIFGRLLLIAVIIVGLLGTTYFFLPEFFQVVTSSFMVVGRYDKWYSTISEWYPLFFSGTWPLAAELVNAAKLYGLGLFCTPLVLLVLIKEWSRSHEKRPSVLFLLLWGCSFFLLALYRRRFAYYFVVPLSLLLALGWWTVVEFIARRQGRKVLSFTVASLLLSYHQQRLG